MTAETKKKFRPSLSTNILIGLVLGILCGIFFGEYCAPLEVFGNAFIKLLQMTILPYIVISLVAGIGRLSFNQARVLGIKAGLLILVFWAIAFAVILAMPMAYPDMESASFFSTSMVEVKKEVNFLDLYIPSNPFSSMANSVIPATVLFSISVGIAMIGIKDKHNLIQNLSILSTALTRVARFVVYLTPIGVFAISASAAGTMTVQEFGRLQAYFIPFILAAILFTFWILPVMVMACTPFKYKDIVGLSKDALITAFTTSNLFIILPVLIQNCNDLLEKYKMKHKDSASFIDIIVPVSFNFPNIGKLLALLFILFAAWFSGNSLSLSDYPNFVFTGLFSFFGSINIALPFLLDILQIPSDFFELYILTGIINGNFATLLAAMNLLIFTLMATCAITGFLSINWKKLLIYTAITILLTAGIITGTRTYLSLALTDAYTKDKVIAGMHLLQDRVPEIVHKTVPPTPVVSDPGQSRLERIRNRGVLRIGYRTDFLPFSFINAAGDLVGFDIAMAHRLAKELGVNLEFIPVELEIMARQLKDDHFDIIMAGIVNTPHRLEEMNFSEAYLDVTIALVVKDHRRKEFATLERIKRINGLRIGIYGDERYFATELENRLPKAKVVDITSIPDFFEHNRDDVDALLFAAEPGAAWTLLYPDYSVVIPKPDIAALPLGYPIAKGDQEMVNFLNRWIDMKKKDKTIEKLYNYWILGQGSIEKKPRWSIIRNVLHWVD